MKDEHQVDLADLTPVVKPSQIVPVNLGMLQATTPEELISMAVAIATPLKKLIKERGLFVWLGGDTPHVKVEGWSTMVAMLGVMPQEISVKRISLTDYPECEGWGPAYEAKMALVRVSDQQVVCSASAECGGPDERSWHWRNKYHWEGPKDNRIKICDGEGPVAGSQRRSMAITRAVGKAARVGFSWVMVLAGYSPTPYEEFDQSDRDKHVDPDATPPPKGKDPRDDMGSRDSYTPGGKNPPRQEATKQDDDVKLITAKFKFVCEICEKPGKAGDPIAYKSSQDGPHTAHVDCYNKTQEVK